jgi:hypothetical protein
LASVRRKTGLSPRHSFSKDTSSSKIGGASGNFDPYQMLLQRPFNMRTWRRV